MISSGSPAASARARGSTASMLVMRALISTLRAISARPAARRALRPPGGAANAVSVGAPSALCVGDLPQRLLEHLGWLAALDQVAVVDHDRRHRMDARFLPH